MNFRTIGFQRFPDYDFGARVMRSGVDLSIDTEQKCYKILFLEDGTLHLRVNDSDMILVGANALCLHDRDYIEIVNDYGSAYYLLNFTPTVINPRLTFEVITSDNVPESEYQDRFYLYPFIREPGAALRNMPLSSAETDTLNQNFHSLHVLLTQQDDPNRPCRSRSHILFILFALSRTDESKSTFIVRESVSSCTPLIADVIHYLQTSYQEKITVEKLSAHFHTNRTTLLAEFRKSTGQSVNRYLTRLRMTMAAALLRDTMLSMTEICEKTGFADISYFSKTFKKEICYTPSEYRRLSAS